MDSLNGTGDFFVGSFVLEFEIGKDFELMLLPKSTPGNPLLLERLFGYIGSAGAVLLTTERDAELVLTTGSIAVLLTTERDAELVLTTGSIGDCVSGAVLGLKIWMRCELGLVAVLVIGSHAKLCSAYGSCSGCMCVIGIC